MTSVHTLSHIAVYEMGRSVHLVCAWYKWDPKKLKISEYEQKSRKSTFLAFKIRGRNLTGSSHYRQHHAPCGLRGSISLFSVLTIPLKKEEKDYIPRNFIHLFVCLFGCLHKERKVGVPRTFFFLFRGMVNTENSDINPRRPQPH